MMTTATGRWKSASVAWPEARLVRYRAITTMPLARMAATFVANSNSAPRHSPGAPD